VASRRPEQGAFARTFLVSSAAFLGAAAIAFAIVASTVRTGAPAQYQAVARTPGAALAWLHTELVARADSPVLERSLPALQPDAARPARVAFHRDGFTVKAGPALLRLSTDGAGSWLGHQHGVSRATDFGGETITVTPARVELYDTVVQKQGVRSWNWRLKSNLTPRPLADGSILFTGDRALTVAPVKIYGPNREDITPADARWTLRREAGAWLLGLSLDDSKLPLPYVIDPSISSSAPGPYREAVIADTPAGYWRLNENPAAFVQSAEIIEPNPIATAVGRTRRSRWSEDDIH